MTRCFASLVPCRTAGLSQLFFPVGKLHGGGGKAYRKREIIFWGVFASRCVVFGGTLMGRCDY